MLATIEAEAATESSEGGDAPLVWLMPQGTRGDLQPHIALAVDFRKAGFRVRIFGGASFKNMGKCILIFSSRTSSLEHETSVS